jgi:VanZ family protein
MRRDAPLSGRRAPLAVLLAASLALASGTAIELLQRVLPLGRVVSPLDALLNATGAVVAGLLVAVMAPMQPSTA